MNYQIAIENANSADDEAILSQRSNIRFEWVESVFLKAYRDGHWLLIEDVNCCNSAGLDCLNSCLESADGELVLPVDNIKTIRRHPNFRLICRKIMLISKIQDIFHNEPTKWSTLKSNAKSRC